MRHPRFLFFACLAMPERKIPRRPPSCSATLRRGLPYRRPPPRPKHRTDVNLLRRYSSEPALWTVRLLSDSDAAAGFSRYQTCTNVFQVSPSLLRSPANSMQSCLGEEVKVVVSVTVEGSPGPVRTMLRLGNSVEEAIGAVVERYGREGRSPRLDRQAAGSFQLHHSHFSLQSLNKCDKIGDVGGRNFYLQKTCSSNKMDVGGEERNLTKDDSPIGIVRGHTVTMVPQHLFFSFMAKKFTKIGRRTRKLWRMLTCNM